MRAWALIGLVLVVTGCAGGSRLYHADYGRYSASTAFYAARDGKMPLAVYGTPVAGDPAVLAQAIADSMRGTHVNYNTEFVPTATPDLAGYRTVVVFGQATPETVCDVKDSTGMATESPTPMLAAFCLGDEEFSYVSGFVPAIGSASDPVLARLMRVTGFTLFPRRNPNHIDHCGGGSRACGD